MPDEPVAAEEEAPGEAAGEEGGSLAEEREVLAGGEAGVVEREALEEATGAFLEEEAGCLERLLEEKRASMLEKV